MMHAFPSEGGEPLRGIVNQLGVWIVDLSRRVGQQRRDYDDLVEELTAIRADLNDMRRKLDDKVAA